MSNHLYTRGAPVNIFYFKNWTQYYCEVRAIGGSISPVKPTTRFRGPYEAHALGGRASMAKLTPEERIEKARKAGKLGGRPRTLKKAA